MSDRERLKSMIKPRSKEGRSWFVAHFDACKAWHPVFVEFMDLRHRLNAQPFPTKFFQYCLLDDFDWADEGSTRDKWINAPDELKCTNFGGKEDCIPITAGQFSEDEGPISEANRAAWRKFTQRHSLDNTDLTRAADEMQPAIDYYITHYQLIGGLSIWGNRRDELEEPTPLPAWLAGVVEHEPEPWPDWMRPSGQLKLKEYYAKEEERVAKINAARGLTNDGRKL